MLKRYYLSSFTLLILSLFNFISALDVTYGVATNQGSPRHQEDKYAIEHQTENLFGSSYAAVFDGQWGSGVSKYLSNHLLSFITQEFITKDKVAAPFKPEMMKSAFQKMNLSLRKLAFQGMPFFDTGSTAAVSFIPNALTQHPILYIAHVGDSRIVNALGQPYTNDHTLKSPTERNRITEYNIINECEMDRVKGYQGGSLTVTRSFGYFFDFPIGAKPEVSFIPLYKVKKDKYGQQFIIIASRGIWDNVSNDIAAQIVSESLYTNPDVELAAQKVLLYAIAKDVEKSHTPLNLNAIAQSPATIHNSDKAHIGMLIKQFGTYAHDNQTIIVQLFKP